MVNYKFSKIFKLYEVDNPNNYYISSTTEPCLRRKLQQLKKQYQFLLLYARTHYQLSLFYSDVTHAVQHLSDI